MSKIIIINYGVNNIKSITAAIASYSNNVIVTSDLNEIKAADKLILPGTGSYQVGMERLRSLNLIDAIKEHVKNKPIFGICLGMQLLFSKSYEHGETEGLGIVKGNVVKITDRQDIKIPFIDWSTLITTKDSKILHHIKNGKDMVYFVHSYACKPDNRNIESSYTEYCSIKICASIEDNLIFGTQFHPEKSGDCGLKILENFIKL